MDVRAPPRATYVFGAFELDAAHGVLTRDGAPVVITPRVFDTLLYLVENPGRVVSKDEMLQALWPGRIADETNLSVAVSTLRRVLGDGAAGGERMIVTAPGRGYRFIAEVRVQSTPQPALAPVETATPAAAASRRRGWWGAGVAAAALAATAAVAVLLLAPWKAGHLPQGRTGVVLADFQNFTGDPTFDHVLGKALEVDLAQSPFLQVMSKPRIAETLDLMRRPKDAPLGQDLAQAVCARNNGGAVIAGTVARLGARYELTLSASDCINGHVLDEEKQEANGKEAVAGAIDRLSTRARRKLGESSASIARFDVPLLPEKTASFEALRAYSEGVWLVDHGQSADAIRLFRYAASLDPNFTADYEALAIVYMNARQYPAAAEATTRAFALRDNVSERRKLQISDIYYHDVSKDLTAQLDNLRLWTRLYPTDFAPWTSIANLQSFVGQHREAVDAARRALALRDDAESSYAILIRAETRAGLFDQARAVGDRAIAKGLAGQNTHTLLMMLAYARHDLAGVQSQIDWAKGKSAEAHILFWAAKIALAEGQVKRAEALNAQAVELGRPQGLSYQDQAAQALMLAEFGLTDQARALLGNAAPDADQEDFLNATARPGDPALAEADLTRALAKSPSDTLLHDCYAPMVHAALLLRENRGAEAARALAPAAPYELRDYDLLYEKGQALLAAGDGPGAANAFRLILANPGLGPDPEFPLAHLGLARALKRSGDIADSRREYAAFFAAWKTADPDLPILRAAKVEAGRLGGAAGPV